MKPRVLDWLVCPICGGDLEFQGAVGAGDHADRDGSEIEAGRIACRRRHAFPIVAGVPSLLSEATSSDDANSIRESFSREWSTFDWESDRTWGQSVDERRQDFLRFVGGSADSLQGKLVLDAGCGNGTLSHAITEFGCEVVAADLSKSVYAAHHYFAGKGAGRTHFVHADLMQPPFRPETFDIVFCAGVLHHTPDTRATFNRVVEAVAPGGTMFVWLYWKVPGLKLKIKSLLRRAIAPLPAPVKYAIVLSLLPQAMFRQYVRSLIGRDEPGRRLKWRERLVILLDSYTPRYRWEHTPEEVYQWYRDAGFTDMKTTEEGRWGFGVSARKPARREADARLRDATRRRSPAPA